MNCGLTLGRPYVAEECRRHLWDQPRRHRNHARPVCHLVEDWKVTDSQAENREAGGHQSKGHSHFNPGWRVPHPRRTLHPGDTYIQPVHDETEYDQNSARHHPRLCRSNSRNRQNDDREEHSQPHFQKEHTAL